jgi:copper chaperone NosL
MTGRDVPWFKVAAVFALSIGVGLVWMVIRRGASAVDDVQPIDWHKQPCAHCQMLIGEPRHAAQLITRDGEVLSFDDPGCALQYVNERSPQIHRLWFHHGHDQRWLTAEKVGFAVGGNTPMGFGLVAVDLSTPGALDITAAQAHVRRGIAAHAGVEP